MSLVVHFQISAWYTLGLTNTPTAPECLRKTAMFLSSGVPDMYDGAKFSYDGDFLGYLGLEGCGIFTNHDNDVFGKIRKMADSL